MPVKEVSVRNFCGNSAIALDYANGTIAFLQYTSTDGGYRNLSEGVQTCCENILYHPKEGRRAPQNLFKYLPQCTLEAEVQMPQI